MITAVDIGATKTLIANFSDDGHIQKQVKFPTPADKEEFLKQLAEQLQAFGPIITLSVGAPGVVTDGVLNADTNLVWEHWPLRDILQKQYDCPVFLLNDANMAALAEVNACSPVPKLGIYLTVSTGIGGGTVGNGKLLLNASEFGQMIFDFEGKPQPWEHFASGKALFALLGKRAQDLTEPSEWHWLAERLAVGLQAIIPALEPDVIIFGGGVGKYFDQFKQPLEAILASRPIKLTTPTRLQAAQHPEEAVIYGCYYHATHQSR